MKVESRFRLFFYYPLSLYSKVDLLLLKSSSYWLKSLFIDTVQFPTFISTCLFCNLFIYNILMMILIKAFSKILPALIIVCFSNLVKAQSGDQILDGIGETGMVSRYRSEERRVGKECRSRRW